jgi:hypothetical protein
MKQKNSVKKSRFFFKKWSVMSLRNRIAFYYTITTAFLIALVFAIIYFTVERIVYRQFDEEIKKEISEILSESQVSPSDFKGFSSFQNQDIDSGISNKEK